MSGPITVSELMAAPPLAAPALAHARGLRRLPLGELLTLTFENRATILATLHSIMSTEGMTDPQALQAECDVYNALLPRHGLSVALSVRDHAAVRRLAGLETHLWLALGAQRLPAQFFVPLTVRQHVSFALDDDDRALLADAAVPAALTVDLAHSVAQTVLPTALRRALLEDMS